MKIVRLTLADAPRLQLLLEQCSHLYELHDGRPTPPDAAEDELMALPPGRGPDDLLMFAVEDERGAIQAAAQLYRDYPSPGVWWIGMLVVAPELRSRGIGAGVIEHVIEVARRGGATEARLLVSPENPRGKKFWRSVGFTPTGEAPQVTSRSGHVTTECILSRLL